MANRLVTRLAEIFGDCSPVQKKEWKERRTRALELLAGQSPRAVVDLAVQIWELDTHFRRWAASDLINHAPGALRALRVRDVERMGKLVDHWGSVDALSSIAGPAWRQGVLTDRRLLLWTRSRSRWWRRTALVCTVYLNAGARGGEGDLPRTLMICERLKADRDDMVVKGMSWALRALISVDRRAVQRFLADNDDVLAARVKREVRNKLETGRKNPRR